MHSHKGQFIKYEVKLLRKAHRDIDEIFTCISGELQEPNIAESMFNSIKNTILSFGQLPYKGAERKLVYMLTKATGNCS